MKIMAFDPGATTGVAIYKDGDSWVSTSYRTFELTGLLPVWDQLHTTRPDRIVCESFLYQRRDKVVLRPVEVIGVIRLYSILESVPMIEQTPAHGKRFWTDDKIKKVGLWATGQTHGMDALRHLLYYQTFVHMDRSQEILGRLK